jgi:hypothetical protein
LLQFDSPINNSIIHQFLNILSNTDKSIKILDTNFSHDLINKNWEEAFHLPSLQ